MSSDPIAAMLTTIRNGGAAKKKIVETPRSGIKLEILKIFKDNFFIEDFTKTERSIKIYLKYIGKEPAIIHIRRISKPGVRIYKQSKQFRPILSGHGMAIISTPKGLMTDIEAKEKRLGGEVICEVW